MNYNINYGDKNQSDYILLKICTLAINNCRVVCEAVCMITREVVCEAVCMTTREVVCEAVREAVCRATREVDCRAAQINMLPPI